MKKLILLSVCILGLSGAHAALAQSQCAVPKRGIANQVVIKQSSADCDTGWASTSSAVASPEITPDFVDFGANSMGLVLNAASIANSKLANETANTVKCNNTGSAAAPSDCTVAQVQQLIGTPSSTWASRGSGSYVGQTIRITDVGPAGLGSLFRWDGTFWHVQQRTYFYFDVTTPNGVNTTTADQVLKTSTPIPAGLLQSCTAFRVVVGFNKSATATAATSWHVRLGTAGTTSDPSLLTGNFAAGFRNYLVETTVVAASTTSVVALDNQNVLTGGSTTAFPTGVTVPDISANALILTATIAMAASSGDTPAGAQMIIELQP